MESSAYQMAVQSVRWQQFFTALPDFTPYPNPFNKLDSTIDLKKYRIKPASTYTSEAAFLGLNMSFTLVIDGLREEV
jgi:hypothetical protein